MSISLGPEDLGYHPPPPATRQGEARLARRRTVSTSFEQVRRQVRELLVYCWADLMVMSGECGQEDQELCLRDGGAAKT